MKYEQIIVERNNQVEMITLNRPEKRNAWTYRMQRELIHAIESSNEDPSVGAILMTGAGKGFCAGADMTDTLKKQIDGENPQAEEDEGSAEKEAPRDWVGLVRESKPLIAAVNGASVGIGLTQILPFDIIVASELARFGMFFIKMGLVPELASTHFLVQRTGFGKASEMCLSGRLYGAKEAFDIGLADHITPHEALMETAYKIAEGIAENPVPQLRLIKQLITQNACEPDFRMAARREHDLIEYCFTTPEHKEAVAAFLEKRPPKFR
ncbi:MAG: enoyl-CoA hydratase-related protein [Desulfobacterales bacterium]